MKNLFAAVLTVSIATVAADTHRERRDAWVIPPDNYVPAVPESCANSTYCTTKCNKYPQSLLDEIVTRNNLQQFSIQDEQPIFENRLSYGESGESTLCKSVTTFDLIYQAKNEEGEWRYIIQSEAKKYKQILLTSVCSSVKRPCDSVAVFKTSVTSRCEQQYASRILFSLGPDGELARGTFKIPSCCVCTYTYI